MNQPPRIYATPVGMKRHELTRQTFLEAGEDPHGQPAGEWGGDFAMWGFVRPLSAREIEIARQNYQLATHVVTVDYDAHTTDRSRFEFNGRHLYVGYARNIDEGNHTHECLCSEGEPDE